MSLLEVLVDQGRLIRLEFSLAVTRFESLWLSKCCTFIATVVMCLDHQDRLSISSGTALGHCGFGRSSSFARCQTFLVKPIVV